MPYVNEVDAECSGNEPPLAPTHATCYTTYIITTDYTHLMFHVKQLTSVLRTYYAVARSEPR